MPPSADTPAPRIAPGSRAEIGRTNAATIAVLAKLGGSGSSLNVWTTLARNRKVFRGWVRFVGALTRKGDLPPADAELLVLRVAHNCGSEYEWRHHERIGRTVGLSDEQIARVREGADATGWTAREAALLRAADELHGERRTISDEVWSQLAAFLDEAQLIEVCLLVGHYEMLAMTLNSVGVPLDSGDRSPRFRRVRRGER